MDWHTLKIIVIFLLAIGGIVFVIGLGFFAYLYRKNQKEYDKQVEVIRKLNEQRLKSPSEPFTSWPPP